MSSMLNSIKNLFFETIIEQEINIMDKFLIVGLGNIGREYTDTRHNIGFKILDFFAQQEDISFETLQLGFVAKHRINGKQVFLLKPNTYMNLSGKALKFWMDKESIPQQNILVITDDLNLSFGVIRIRSKGSDGGHNGLKNINYCLNSNEYPRFRFGISDEFKKGKQIDYVLGEWNDSETEKLKERLEIASKIIQSFVSAGIENTMTGFNGR